MIQYEMLNWRCKLPTHMLSLFQDDGVLKILSSYSGRDSFATRLFWTTCKFAYGEIRKMMGPHPRPNFNMFSLTAHYVPLNVSISRTIACLERLSLHEPRPVVPDVKEKRYMPSYVAEQVRRDVAGTGNLSDAFLDIYETEEYLQQAWAVQPSSTHIKRMSLESGPENRPRISNAFIKDSYALIRDIAESTMCFGNGPRFPKAHIDNCMRAFLT